MIRALHNSFVATCVLALFAPLAQATEPSPHVISAQGALPLILTVPHDGDLPLGNVPVRTNGVVVRDTFTRTLTERVATALENKLGKRPYVVIAPYSRRFLDVNRAESDALESPMAIPAYRAYHAQVKRYVAEVKQAFPKGALLLDIHGQGDDPNTIFRGTRNGLTVTELLARHGRAALQGEKSILGVMSAKGHNIFPAIDASSLREEPKYGGGPTVAMYGSHQADGIDAIQLELGKNQRTSAKFAEDLADALIVFMYAYGMLGQ